MEIRHLRYFKAVAEQGSLSRAAAALGISQPGLSRQVSALERDLEAQLLVRHGRGVTLTEAGVELARHARVVLDEVDHARQAVAALAGVSGEVALGVAPSAAEVLAPSLVEQFRRRHPHTLLRLLEGFGGALHDWLVDGTVDAAVIYNPRRGRYFTHQPLVEEQLGLVGPAGDPRLAGESIPFAEVVSLPLALPRRAQSLRQTLGTEARRRGLTLEVPVEVDSLGVMRELAVRGLAYTVLAPASVRAEREAGRLEYRPIEPSVRRRLVLVTVAGRPLQRVARVLARLVRLEAARLVDSGAWDARSLR